jgi:predicted DNA-binding transcriptional regulator
MSDDQFTTTVTTGAAVDAVRATHLADALPVLGWVVGRGLRPNSGRPFPLQVAVVDLRTRPDVADLARVFSAEEAGQAGWTGHVVTGWTAMLEGHDGCLTAPLVCDAEVTRPVACRVRLAFDYLVHRGVVRELERTGWIGVIDARRVDLAATPEEVGRHVFAWRFRPATLAAGMAEIDALLREHDRGD